MKKMRIFSLLLVLAMMLALPVMARSDVTFEDGKLIVFHPTGGYTGQNMFAAFSGIMPGDHLTEEMTVENRTDDFDYIKVYIRAERHNRDTNPLKGEVLEELLEDDRREGSVGAYMEEFLSQLELDLWNGETLIFDDQPDDEGTLAENVYLGTLQKGESLKLRAELTVPVTLDNEFSDRIGEVDWVFVVEGFDDPTPPPEEKTMLTVRKLWVNAGENRPDHVTVELLKDGAPVEQMVLNDANQWTYTWGQLDKGSDWDIREINIPEGYTVSYAKEGSVITVTNTGPEQPPVPVDPVDLTVTKKWDDNGKDRPESVKMTLYNGEEAVETVRLGSWNNWTYTWRDLDGAGQWRVLESDVPKGYTPYYSQKDGVVTVTNTATLIQTGQNRWPAAVLGGAGLLMLVAGLLSMRKKRENG